MCNIAFCLSFVACLSKSLLCDFYGGLHAILSLKCCHGKGGYRVSVSMSVTTSPDGISARRTD